ncbi:uncharacterized protein LOC123011353 [Tribolium madens]|uniref:uncharacterized protein LOC123011353 n=1 Tax=Tribolium madens TaxID=41895 RepID=UPI001CF7547D|nr:uncharacterized protein LOC123011353 [Tribolium madens]
MKLPLFCLFLALTLQISLSTSIRNIEKRQICSNGGCNTCDGRSCNSCSNNVCCSSISCNQCVNQCANDCNSVQCTNNCVRGCQTSCQNQPQSCNSQSCSSCVNRCSSQCTTNQCINSCANNCGGCKDKIENSNDAIIVEPPQPSSVIVNNTNNNLVNLTTQVDIHNVVHNFNNITIPVYVNTTNINNINLSHSDETRSYTNSSNGHIEYIPIPQPIPIVQPQPQIPQFIYPQATQENCCTVLHPRQCYTAEGGESRCFIRRHRECSSSCTSPVVTIEQNDDERTQNCQFIRNWPYAYCGNYRRGDCNSCYTCGGNYNPSQCFKSSGCSDLCRRGAPPCVADQNGLRCN